VYRVFSRLCARNDQKVIDGAVDGLGKPPLPPAAHVCAAYRHGAVPADRGVREHRVHGDLFLRIESYGVYRIPLPDRHPAQLRDRAAGDSLVPDENKPASSGSARSSPAHLGALGRVFLLYDRSQGGLQFVERAAWVPSMGIQYLNAVDGFSLPMVLLTGIVFFTGVLTMWELENRVKEFYAFYFCW